MLENRRRPLITERGAHRLSLNSLPSTDPTLAHITTSAIHPTSILEARYQADAKQLDPVHPMRYPRLATIGLFVRNNHPSWTTHDALMLMDKALEISGPSRIKNLQKSARDKWPYLLEQTASLLSDMVLSHHVSRSTITRPYSRPYMKSLAYVWLHDIGLDIPRIIQSPLMLREHSDDTLRRSGRKVLDDTLRLELGIVYEHAKQAHTGTPTPLSTGK